MKTESHPIADCGLRIAELGPTTRPIAVLCAARSNHYRGLDGVEVYDLERDARTFPGGMPAIVHPPCRGWSAFCRHQAKPLPGEKELGLWCVKQVIECGGVVEQPAHSLLWRAAGLPEPGWTHTGSSWSMEVLQAWWGFPQAKRTWLYFRHIPPPEVQIPIQLRSISPGDKRTWQLMSKTQRSQTTQAFAHWLVDAARKVKAS